MKEDNTIKLVPVTLGRDRGKELEILAGVKAGDRVVNNSADDLADGMPVRVAEKEPRP